MRERVDGRVVVDGLIGDRAGDRRRRRDRRRDNARRAVAGRLARRVSDRDGKPGRHGAAGRDLMIRWLEDQGIQIRRHRRRRASHRVDAVADRAPVGRRVRVGQRAVGYVGGRDGDGLGLTGIRVAADRDNALNGLMVALSWTA